MIYANQICAKPTPSDIIEGGFDKRSPRMMLTEVEYNTRKSRPMEDVALWRQAYKFVSTERHNSEEALRQRMRREFVSYYEMRMRG